MRSSTILPATLLLALGRCACPVGPDGGTADAGASGHTTSSSSHATSGGTSSSASPIASSSGGASSSGDASMGGATSSSSSSSSSSGYQPAYVFAHSDSELYRLDANTLALTDLGPFHWADASGNPAADDQMTDLAIDGLGHLWGCSFTALYQIDMPGIVARQMTSLNDEFNGLSFVPPGFLDPQFEVLVGASNTDGTLYRIDTSSGVATTIGSYGNFWVSSGDIVAIHGDAMYATVKQPISFSDSLATIDPMTGHATIIGSIGTSGLYGLGYWAGTLYGFSTDGTIVSIDRATGHGTVVHTENVSFWGAGVTTNAKLN